MLACALQLVCALQDRCRRFSAKPPHNAPHRFVHEMSRSTKRFPAAVVLQRKLARELFSHPFHPTAKPWGLEERSDAAIGGDGRWSTCCRSFWTSRPARWWAHSTPTQQGLGSRRSLAKQFRARSPKTDKPPASCLDPASSEKRC